MSKNIKSSAHKTLKSISSLSSADKYDILDLYIKCKLSNTEICDKYNVSYKSFEHFIRTTYSNFQNARETKLLLATTARPDLFLSLRKQYIETEHINQEFLDKLSEPDQVLTDSEILFCEFLSEYGDDAKAIEKSGLSVGLKKNSETTSSYRDSLRMRAFYLKKKPNVQLYMAEQQKRNLTALENGKEFIQTNLITVIEQLKNNNDLRYLPSQLKALESLGRTVGAFDDKLTIDSANGDDVLDRILKKAKGIKEDKPMLAYSSEDGGVEIYD